MNFSVSVIFSGVAIGRQVYFPFARNVYKLKNHQFYLKNAKQVAYQSIQGIKGPTPLSSILLLPTQAPYDSMHLVYHGHVKTLLYSWKNMFSKDIFTNGSLFLSKVVLPHSFKYQFTSLSDFSNWKAKMLRDFFLYISPIFVVFYLPADYSVHFLLYYSFVKALYFFTDKKQLTGIDRLFYLYHESLSHLYSARSELATIHCHSHLLSQVNSHGALCFTSCFPRESYLAYVLKLCKGKTHVLNQLVTWYEISQNTQHTSSFTLHDLFSKETFSVSFVDNNFIISVHHDFTSCLQAFSASASHCKFFSRYYRGLVCFHSICYSRRGHSISHFHSICYSRRGHSISHFVSIQSSSCVKNDLCFATVLFYFSLHNQYYAFVKHYPCLSRSLLSSLNRSVEPLVKKLIDSYFKFFDEEVFLFKIIPVSSIAKKVIKIPTLEDNICSFATVDFEFEHD
jgi:hypothetical protein